MCTDNFIVKTRQNGLKLLSIKDLKNITFQHLLEVKDACITFTDSLQVQITPSHIIIAAA